MNIWKNKLTLLLLTAAAFTCITTANAHLMNEQQGTLNFSADGAYITLSLPLAAFEGVDEDDNGDVSIIEFNRHRATILDSIRREVVLSSANEKFELDGLRLAPQLAHGESVDKLASVVLLGRFSYSEYPQDPTLRINLFGTTAAERILEIAVTRKSVGYSRIHTLTPENSSTLIY